MTNVLELLKSVNAIITDSHFVGTSGKHFATYINKDALYPYTTKTSQICAIFADKFKEYQPEAVVGPALGGIILSQWTAAHLGMMSNTSVLGVYAEKKDAGLQLTRGYDLLLKNKRVVVVEDLTTTGGSLKQAIEAVQQAGGKVVAAAVMVNKNPKEVTSEYFGVPFFALAEMSIELYTAENCPLCKSGVPINTSIGHGKAFVESQKKIN